MVRVSVIARPWALPSGGTRVRSIALVALACVLVAAPVPRARASALFSKLDPRLSAALAPGAEPIAVWVDFADKGEQGPADLAARLARAEAGLAPGARARRVRAGLRPLVDYLDLPVDGSYLDALRALGCEPLKPSRWLNGCEVHAGGVQLARLAELACVRRLGPVPLAAPRRAEPVGAESEIELRRPIGAASATGKPAFYGQTYSQLLRLGVPAMHDSGYVGAGITIAVLDDGFDYYDKHTATRDIHVLSTQDFVRGGADVQDTLGYPCQFYFQHGTYTLSAMGGYAPGVFIGPAYGASYLLAHTEDDCSEKPIEMVNWMLAAEWADSLGADLISSSLGYLTFPDSMSGAFSLTPSMLDGHTALVTRAAEIAAAKGILVVNSAGNSGPGGGTLDAPADASGDSVLAVGALDSLGTVASYSSRGPTADGRTKPDLVAQGSRVLFASASGSPNLYVRNSGTSFACPLVAGMAACLLQARPDWSPIRVLRALKMSASRAWSPDNDYGWGLPNGLAALQWVPDTSRASQSLAFDFALESANPMRGTAGFAHLRFALPANAAPARGRVSVVDVTGRRVRTVHDDVLLPGRSYRATWDGTDSQGRRAPSGVYFLAFEAAGHRSVLRIACLR